MANGPPENAAAASGKKEPAHAPQPCARQQKKRAKDNYVSLRLAQVPPRRVEYWSIPRDASSRAHSMARNSALLYRNKRPKDTNSPRYIGVLRLADGQVFWVGAWRAVVNGEQVVEIRLSPKTN
jgi:hypothetical protein